MKRMNWTLSLKLSAPFFKGSVLASRHYFSESSRRQTMRGYYGS